MTEADYILESLVKALDNTFWSSWQDTSQFSDALNTAKAYLESIDD